MRKVNECVLYQLFLRPFTPEGTLKGAQKMLSHLKDVGVDIIYLTPVTYSDEHPDPDGWSNRQRECGFNNPQNPYRVGDYYRIDPEYGTEDDLYDFVKAAHALDMYVLLDVVYLHCGPTCPLVTEHPEYFEYDENGKMVTTKYRFPKFDLSKQETRAYFRDNLMYFIRRFDVDGYRCDCGGQLPADFWKDCIDQMRVIKPDLIMLNEGRELRQLEAGFDLDYGISWWQNLEKLVTGQYCNKSPYKNPWTNGGEPLVEGTVSAKEILAAIKEMSDGKPEGTLGALMVDNHDHRNDAWHYCVERVVGKEGMECAMAVNFTAKGYPYLYTGVEIADQTRHGILGSRKYAPNYRVNWSKALTPEGQSRMAFIRAMSALKHENPALYEGDMQVVSHNCEEKVMAFTRNCDKQKVLVMINFSDKEMDVQLDQAFACEKVLYSREAEGFKLGGYGILVAQIG